MFICLHYVQGFVQVFAKCCRVTALVVPCADNSHRQNLQEEGGSKSEAEHKGNDRETAKSRRQYVRENREIKTINGKGQSYNVYKSYWVRMEI